MKLKWFILLGLVSILSAVTIAAPPVTRNGTAVLHYKTRNSLTGTELAPNASGDLRMQHNVQGGSAKQTFTLTLSGLEPSTSYLLGVLIGDQTDSTLVPIVTDDTNESAVASTFTTDSNGNAKLSYSGKPPKGKGPKKQTVFPAALDPLTDIRAVSVVNTDTQTVAYAWINDASSIQYMIKRNLTPEDGVTATGSISLIANQNSIKFKLLAGGLEPNADHHLALDSNVVASATSDADGVLEIEGWPDDAAPLLDLRLLQLWDATTNAVILSTPLPK